MPKRRLWSSAKPDGPAVKVGLGPDLPAADDLILRRGQLAKRKRPPAMQLLGADAHLGAEAEFASVGKASGGIPINRRRVDQTQELLGVPLIPSHNGFRVPGGIAIDVLD